MTLKCVWRVKFYFTLVKNSVLLYLLQNRTANGNSVFLTGTFIIGSTTDHSLALSETRSIGTEEPCGNCALSCVKNQIPTTSSCLAFTCNPLDKTCNFYTKTDDHVSSSVDVFLFQIRDVWHTISINGKLFSILLTSHRMTYVEARTHCHSLGGYLLEFDNLEEYQAVEMIISGESTGYSYVGANDIDTEGQWMTDRGRILVELSGLWLWNINEPNNQANTPGGEDCAIFLYHNGKLNDTPCDREYSALCERDIL